MSSLKTIMGAMEKRLDSRIREGASEVSGVVQQALEVGKGELGNMVNQLESKGLVNQGAGYDIPGALSEIFERLGGLSSPTEITERLEKPSSPDIIVLEDESGELVYKGKEPTKDEQDSRGAERNKDGVMDGRDLIFSNIFYAS